MSKFTVEEMNLICIYNTGSRTGLLSELAQMKTHLEKDETELLGLAKSVMDKIDAMSDDEFENITADLISDFEQIFIEISLVLQQNSINKQEFAEDMAMSYCTFLAADCFLPEVKPEKDYPLEINVDEGTIYDGGANDNYSFWKFDEVGDYTDKSSGVVLDWNYYTVKRGGQIIEYIKKALESCDSVELWRVWLMDYYEYNERPYYRRSEISIDELTEEDIKKISDMDVWSSYKNRPTYYCLKITR